MTALSRRLLVALIVVLLIAQQLFTVPGDSRFTEAFHNSLHVPWFALVTLILIRLVGWRAGFAVAVLLAFGSEALQWLTGRQPSFADVARDGLGALLAAAVMLWAQGWRKTSGILALAVCGLTTLPLVQVVQSKAEMRALFPVLMAADVKASVDFLQSSSPLTHDQEGVSFRFSERRWPGIHITEPVPDWQGYDALHVELIVDEGPELLLYVSVRQAEEGGATGFAQYQLKAGKHELQVPLSKLLTRGSAPVDDVFIYSRGHFAGREITLKRVYLAR